MHLRITLLGSFLAGLLLLFCRASIHSPLTPIEWLFGDFPSHIKTWFSSLVNQSIPQPQSQLALGYLLGLKGELPSTIVEQLKIVGLSHIVVASGTHLSILVNFARLSFGRLSRFAALWMSLFFILVFISLIGLTPSMCRAGLVSALSLVAWYYGRRFQPWRLLFIVAAATLLYDPTYLTNLAWLLSFAAFAGIMLVAPTLTQFFYGTQPPSFFAATLLASIAASLTCLPILVYFFGSVSLLSLLTNLLIPPTLALCMGLTFFTGLFTAFSASVLSVVFAPLASLLGWLTTRLLDYHLFVIQFFGTQDYFIIHLPAHQPLVFLLYLPLVLLLFLNYLFQKKFKNSLITNYND